MSDQPTFEERLWSKIERRGPDECWPARGGIGYRSIWKNKSVTRAHRAVYELTHGVNLTPEIIVRHTCDNPPCCNPRHLLAGTAQDNVDDKMRRGRDRCPGPNVPACGSRHGMAKLSEEQVLAIRADTRAQTAIARIYGVNQQQISAIKLKKKWGHL